MRYRYEKPGSPMDGSLVYKKRKTETLWWEDRFSSLKKAIQVTIILSLVLLNVILLFLVPWAVPLLWLCLYVSLFS